MTAINRHTPNNLISNYNTSLLLYLNDEYDLLLVRLNKLLPYIRKNGLEIILGFTNKETGSALYEYIQHHPFINWQLVHVHLSDINYPQIYNALAEKASKRFLCYMHTKMELSADIISEARRNYENNYNSYTTTAEPFTNLLGNPQNHFEDNQPFLFVSKITAKKLGLLDEKFDQYLFSILNFQSRLDLAGYKRIRIITDSLNYKQSPDPVTILSKDLLRSLYPTSPLNTNYLTTYGSNILLSLYSARPREKQFLEYIKQFEKVVFSKEAFAGKYKIILLSQFYNESEHMGDFIVHMSKYVDGIIFLDDGSIDDSYEKAIGEKILIKAGKRRERFDDLANRNLLLDLASFVESEWFLFMDLDERFDPRFVDFNGIIQDPAIDTVSFGLVNLWNENGFFDASTYEDFKLSSRHRMFRNIGPMQIQSPTTLHFPAIPYFGNPCFPKILYHHLGNITKEKRQKKRAFYLTQDKNFDLSRYDYLLKEDAEVDLRHISTITFSNNQFIISHDKND